MPRSMNLIEVKSAHPQDLCRFLRNCIFMILPLFLTHFYLLKSKYSVQKYMLFFTLETCF